MIFLPDTGWLTGIVGALCRAVAGIAAFVLTQRWGWKAWPLLLCSAFVVPALVYAATLVALYFVDRAFGLAGGFVVHASWLILIVLVPTVIGAGIGSASHRRRANGSLPPPSRHSLGLRCYRV